MGLFDIIANVASATVKTALTPVAIVMDAATVVTGQEPNNTKDLLKSAGKDASDAIDDIAP